MKIENGLYYAKSHEWVRFEDDGTATIGLSDYAQSELGDLVFVNLPQVGDALNAGDTLGDVESVKAVSDVFCPVTGTVSEVNEELLDAPQRINEDAYGAWLVKLSGVDASDKSGLMTAEEYKEQF